MRVGLDLRHLSGDELVTRAVEADQLGLWAVLVDGPHSTGAITAAELAVVTEHVHLAVWLQEGDEHVTTIAEELAVVDHLSSRRAMAIAKGSPEWSSHLRRLLAGEIVDSFAIAPPPAQTAVPVWDATSTSVLSLTGDLALDRTAVDDARDDGTTHVFVQWPGELRALSRHLVSRALTPDFPQIVADHADVIAP